MTKDIELGTVAASEKLIHDLYLDLRAKIAQWASVTNQTAQARMGYVGQHLVSVVTGLRGGKTGARGLDLIEKEEGAFSEIKTCYRVDQLGKCLDCRGPVAPMDKACAGCGSDHIKRQDDSKWLISIRHEGEFEAILDPKSYYLVLFDFVEMSHPGTIRASIWRVDSRAPGFALCMIDYYFNIRAKSVSKAPFNLWPYQFKFFLMRPELIYQSLITSDNTIETRIFPGRDAPLKPDIHSLAAYARANLLTERCLGEACAKLHLRLKGTSKGKAAMMDRMESKCADGKLAVSDLCDALATCAYAPLVQKHIRKLPRKLKAVVVPLLKRG